MSRPALYKIVMPTIVSDYYYKLESRIGYKLILRGIRYFEYYEAGILWPFPILSVLRRMEERLYQTLSLADNALVLNVGIGNGDVTIYIAKKGLKIKIINLLNIYIK